MDITIHRKNGFFHNTYGKNVPLAIFFEGTFAGLLASGETLRLSLPDVCGALHVGLLDAGNSPYIGSQSHEVISTSNLFNISPSQAVQAFSVRTRGWVFFGVMGLVYLPTFSRWAFVLEADLA